MYGDGGAQGVNTGYAQGYAQGYGQQGNMNGYYGPAQQERGGVVSIPVHDQSPPYQAAYPVQEQQVAVEEKKEVERVPAWSEKQ